MATQGGPRITNIDFGDLAFVVAAALLIMTVIIGHLPALDALHYRLYHIADEVTRKWTGTGR